MLLLKRKSRALRTAAASMPVGMQAHRARLSRAIPTPRERFFSALLRPIVPCSCSCCLRSCFFLSEPTRGLPSKSSVSADNGQDQLLLLLAAAPLLLLPVSELTDVGG